VIFYFGGMPASAREPALHSLATGERDIYQSKDIHLIYMDKPGMGKTPLSLSFQIRRDWPEMVRQVQETLGIRNYSVMGVSNGGPYVMATLTHEATKEHIDSAAIIVGVSNVCAR
jgi:pimeloyl-ACP methyl ester carboxylesterase